jgi:hypothetical protein
METMIVVNKPAVTVFAVWTTFAISDRTLALVFVALSNNAKNVFFQGGRLRISGRGERSCLCGKLVKMRCRLLQHGYNGVFGDFLVVLSTTTQRLQGSFETSKAGALGHQPTGLGKDSLDEFVTIAITIHTHWAIDVGQSMSGT